MPRMTRSAVSGPHSAKAMRPISVSVKPTATAFARMPRLPSSRATTRTIASSPAFAAAPWTLRGWHICAAIDEMATIAPPLALRR